MIVIDPGHSATAPGTRRYGASFEGVSEQAINWAVASITRQLVRRATREAFGTIIECELTRKPMQVISLSKRAQFANKAGADLLVSIHCNADFKDDEYENLAEVEGRYPDVPEPESNGIETFHFPGSEKGRKAAHSIHGSLIEATGARDRGVKEARFSILRKSSMPAVVVEVGFLSNPIERGMLMTMPYQRVIAEGLTHGICNAVIAIGKRPKTPLNRIIIPRRREP